MGWGGWMFDWGFWDYGIEVSIGEYISTFLFDRIHYSSS